MLRHLFSRRVLLRNPTHPSPLKPRLSVRPYSSSSTPPLRSSSEAGYGAEIPDPQAAPSSTSPPLLDTLRAGLKTAMRAKDLDRLTVLRAIIAGVERTKGSTKPIHTDFSLVSLIAKMRRTQEEAAAEFRQAKREDLAAKEDAQIAVLRELEAESGIDVAGEEDLREAARETAQKLWKADSKGVPKMGAIMKAVTERFAGQVVNKEALSGIVKGVQAGYRVKR